MRLAAAQCGKACLSVQVDHFTFPEAQPQERLWRVALGKLKLSALCGGKPLVTSSPFRNRQKHRNLFPILFICSAVSAHDVAFFKLDGNQNVGSGGDREKHVANCHIGRGPKGDDETQHDRVTHKLVEKWRPESQLGILLSTLVKINLAQSKKIEVVNEKRAHQHRRPTQEKQHP